MPMIGSAATKLPTGSRPRVRKASGRSAPPPPPPRRSRSASRRSAPLSTVCTKSDHSTGAWRRRSPPPPKAAAGSPRPMPNPRTSASQTTSTVSPKIAGTSSRAAPPPRRASHRFSPQPSPQIASATSSQITAAPPCGPRHRPLDQAAPPRISPAASTAAANSADHIDQRLAVLAADQHPRAQPLAPRRSAFADDHPHQARRHGDLQRGEEDTASRPAAAASRTSAPAGAIGAQQVELHRIGAAQPLHHVTKTGK